MSVERADSGTLSKDEIPFSMIATTTVDLLTNSDGLAVWTYLQTKPRNWKIYKIEVGKHFGWGKHKTNAAFKYLETMGLLTITQLRSDDSGKFSNNDFRLHHLPCSKNRSTVTVDRLPESRNQPLVNNKELNNNNHIYKESTNIKQYKTKIKLEDFKVTDDMRAWCDKEGLPDPDYELGKFVDHHLAKGTKYKDAHRLFRNWMRKAKEYKQQSINTRRNNNGYNKQDKDWYYNKACDELQRIYESGGADIP